MNYEKRVHIFRERIREVIEQSGHNHSRFAETIDVDRSTLSQLLSPTDLRLPRADTLACIAKQYKTSADWLLGLTNERPLGTQMVTDPLEFENYAAAPAKDKIIQWHAEVGMGKVRDVPTTLPDLLKTDDVAIYEFRRYSTDKTEQRIRGIQMLLESQRDGEAEMEVCQSLQDLQAFAFGEGVWCDLSREVRIAQLEHMTELLDGLYPRFRWFLFDGREIYSAAFTIFGALRTVVFAGKHYLVFNRREHIKIFSRRFDELIRSASIQPDKTHDFIKKLIADVSRS